MAESNCELALNRRCSFPRPHVESHTSVTSKRSSMSSSCRICLSTILDPASLTCGHRFCEQCLHKYWHAGDKPEFIVCPLCRALVFNVDFSKKEDISSTDLRKTFNTIKEINETEDTRTKKLTIICIKMSILIPIAYYLVRYLRIPLVNMFLQLKLRLRM